MSIVVRYVETMRELMMQ